MSRRSKKKANRCKSATTPAASAATRESASSSAGLSGRWPVWGVCIFLAAIIWLVFGQTLSHEFVNYDDPSYVTGTPSVTGGLTLDGVRWAFTHTHSSNWHPLTTLSHMLDCQLYGLDAGRHHFTNLILHTVAAILLFLVLRQMTGRTWRSAFVATLFGIHPLHVESVAWVAERKDVLSGLFFVVTIGAYVRYARSPSRTRYLAVLLAFALGLMSKSMLVTLPFVLLLLDYWPLGRFERLALADRDGRNCVPVVPWRLLTEKLPLLAMSAASCVATLLAQSGAIIGLERLPLTWRIINALETYVIYLGQAIWPLNLAVFYPHSEMDALQPGRVAGAIGLLVAITAGTLILRRKRPYLITGWLWYLGMLIPVIGVIQVGLQARSDRYTYLPLIGIFLMVTWGVSDWATQWGRKGRQVLSSLAMIVIALLSWITWRQTTFWRTTETLWTHTLAVTAHNYVAHASFGEFLLSHGRVAEAMTHLEKALEISPHHLGAHAKLAEALLRIGNPGAAIPHWEDILQTEPRDPNAQSNLAWVYATCPQPSMRNGPKALALIQNVIKRIGRNNATVLRICAAAYAECGRFSEAMETAKEAWQLAATQGNSTLAADLEDDIVTYQRGFPLRDPNLANVQPRPEQR